MDNLQNMMAEMQKMQQQMQEMAEKQAAESVNSNVRVNIKTVSLDDLNRLSEKLAAAEEALQLVTEEVNGLKQMILDSVSASQEEGVLAQLRGELEKVILNNSYKGIQMGTEYKKIRYDNRSKDYMSTCDDGYLMLTQLYDTIQEFGSVIYNYEFNDQNGEIDELIRKLYRKTVLKYKEEFKLWLGFLSNIENENRVWHQEGYENNDEYVDLKDDTVSSAKISMLNKKRSKHLNIMQKDAMEQILAKFEQLIIE